MLRRLAGVGAWERRTMDWEAGARLARRALGWAALAGAMFLLCRAGAGQWGQAAPLAPFAMAFLSAALLTERSAAALLAGCFAGALHGPLRDFDLRLPVGAAIVLGGSLAWPALRRMLPENAAVRHWLHSRLTVRREGRSPAPNRLARSPNDPALCAALAGAGVLLPGLALSGEALTLPAALEATAASVAAVAAAPFLQAALAGGRRLDPERRIGLCLLMGMLCMGLARLSAPVAVWAGGTLVILLYPGGALAGAGLGGVLTLATGDARLMALLAAGGATAQLCENLSKPTRDFGACGAMLAAGLALNLSPATLAGALLPALTTLPMPEEWARRFLLIARPPTDPRSRAEAVRRQAAAKVSALAAALGEAAEVSPSLFCARRVLEELAGELLWPRPPRRPRLRAEVGAACASRVAGEPSGDSHILRRLDGVRLLALISDGMGSGADAARESRKVARLVGRLMRAGAPLEAALESANALLLNPAGEDMFATADALVVDLMTGEARFGKMAACPTVILRGGELMRVAGGRLPLGILEDARPELTRLRLRPGDTLLMASDGAFDALGAEGIEALLLESVGLAPGQIAERALAAAQRSGGPQDDRTVLCLRLSMRNWE